MQFGLDEKFPPIDFEEVDVDHLDLVAGGSGGGGGYSGGASSGSGYSGGSTYSGEVGPEPHGPTGDPFMNPGDRVYVDWVYRNGNHQTEYQTYNSQGQYQGSEFSSGYQGTPGWQDW